MRQDRPYRVEYIQNIARSVEESEPQASVGYVDSLIQVAKFGLPSISKHLYLEILTVEPARSNAC